MNINLFIVFFNLVFILYENIVGFQCCVGFRYTAKWFGHTYTYVYSSSDSFPIEVITDWVTYLFLVTVINKSSSYKTF